jgi:hypothetical protein
LGRRRGWSACRSSAAATSETTYASDLALVDTRLRRVALGLLLVVLLVLPRFVSSFALDLVTQTALAAIGALALNLLTGLAGQISLGHAGFIAAGAFTTAFLVENRLPSPLLALPAAALVGAALGVMSASALSSRSSTWRAGTLALHHVVLSTRAAEFQNHRSANTGVSIPPPRLGARCWGTTAWYYADRGRQLVLILRESQRRAPARTWMAPVNDAAESVGIGVARHTRCSRSCGRARSRRWPARCSRTSAHSRVRRGVWILSRDEHRDYHRRPGTALRRASAAFGLLPYGIDMRSPRSACRRRRSTTCFR